MVFECVSISVGSVPLKQQCLLTGLSLAVAYLDLLFARCGILTLLKRHERHQTNEISD